jgi:hypothetical protein
LLIINTLIKNQQTLITGLIMTAFTGVLYEV